MTQYNFQLRIGCTTMRRKESTNLFSIKLKMTRIHLHLAFRRQYKVHLKTTKIFKKDRMNFYLKKQKD